MGKALENAKKLLGQLKVEYPFTFISTGSGEAHGLDGAVTGSLRAKTGQSLLVPVPESASMVAGMPETVDFFVKAPQVLADLISEVEGANQGKSD